MLTQIFVVLQFFVVKAFVKTLQKTTKYDQNLNVDDQASITTYFLGLKISFTVKFEPAFALVI